MDKPHPWQWPVNALAACAGFAVAIAFPIAWWIDDHTCTRVFPHHESSATVAAESRELKKALWATYERQEHQNATAKAMALPVIDDRDLPPPVRVVAIDGKTATVLLKGPAEEINYYYSEAWNAVWQRMHHGSSCTMLTETWNGGSVTLPNAPFDM